MFKISGTATGDVELNSSWGQNIKVPAQSYLLCKILHGSCPAGSKVIFFTSNYGSISSEIGGVSRLQTSALACGLVRFAIKKGSNINCTVGLSIQMDTSTDYEPYTERTVTLPYTLNAIPVTSGGNVTIDGQQYIADYVDVERDKLVRMVDSSKLDTTQSIIGKTDWLLGTPTETDLTADEIAAFKALASYYPVTNVSITSDQLDGYTVFNYPISLAKGYDYIKQQLGDARDYLYGIDLMTAEAYVNSEYAAALAEIEV